MLKRNELEEMDLKNGEREDKSLKRSTVKCHSQCQEANFCYELCNLAKMVVLIVFSVAENIGLLGCFVKI